MEFQYQSDKIDKILPKFTAAQYAMRTGIIKETSGKHGEKTSYVKLEHLLFFVYEILQPKDLTLRVYQVKDDNNVYLCASVIDNTSFQFFSTYHFLYNSDNIGLDVQMKIGGDNTYASRYAIKTLFGIPMFDKNDPEHGKDSDDESEVAPVNSANIANTGFQWRQQQGCITQQQDTELFTYCGRNADIKKMVLKQYGVDYSNMLPVAIFREALDIAKVLATQRGK